MFIVAIHVLIVYLKFIIAASRNRDSFDVKGKTKKSKSAALHFSFFGGRSEVMK
jgi:hypothetical protein